MGAPLSRDEFAALMAQGHTVEQIAKLNPDSVRTAGAQPPAPGGTDPLGMIGGMGASALDAIGGPRTLLAAGGIGGTGLLIKKLLARGAAPSATLPPAGPPPPSGPPPGTSTAAPRVRQHVPLGTVPPPAPAVAASTVTPAAAAKQAAEAITSSPALASESPATIQQVRALLLKKPAGSAYSKVSGVFDEPVTTAKGRVVGAIKPRVSRGTPPGETVPIDVQGKPAAVRGAKQRGVTKREIASRQQGMAKAATAPAAAAETDLEFQLQQSVKFEAELAKRGFSAAQRKALRRSAQELIQGAGLRGVAGKIPGALGMLMMINDARTMPQQIDEAGVEVRRAMDPKLARHLEGLRYPEGI